MYGSTEFSTQRRLSGSLFSKLIACDQIGQFLGDLRAVLREAIFFLIG